MFMCLLALGCGGQKTNIDWGPADSNTCPGGQNVRLQSTSAWLLTKPEVSIVYWGSWWVTSQTPQLDNMIVEWNTLANDPRFYSGLSEYGIQPGTLIGNYTTNWNLPNSPLSENYIETELQEEITNGNLPPANANSIYVIELPSGVHSQLDINNGYGGHHTNYNGFSFAVIEYNDSTIMSIATSHEIYEACTDTDGSGFNGGSTESEIGDLCGSSYNLDGYIIQKLWLQSQCKCGP